MSTLEKTTNSLAQTPKPRNLQSLIESSVKELGRALPEHLKPERLVRIALTCIRQNPKLAECTPESFLGALFTSAQLGLEPIAGRAYLLPFNNSRRKSDGTWHTVKEVQFVMGYKGLADLFYNHEKAINLEWGIVKTNDHFEYERGTDSFLRHREAQGERGETTGYWVMANLKNGGKPFHYMSKQECLDHGKKHSKTWDKKNNNFYPDSPWLKDQDSMCLKTVLIQAGKIWPLSVETQTAIGADESSRTYIPGMKEALDVPSETVWDEVEKENNLKIDNTLKKEETK